MSLKEYHAKRDFTKTPEPRGDDGAAGKKAGPAQPAFFCVQKHLASQLHYDFRLEYKGVLLSWAVPKGPSIDSSEKRLAMHVEDHPIEYGNFEGVIPEGYGAGIVMLWDVGTWTPQVDDVDEAIKKGDIKFTLDGYKLKGSWVLVRTRGWGASREAPRRPGEPSKSWLLIKHKDEWAGPIDITTFAPKSVKGGGDFEDILASNDVDVWTSNAPARGGATGQMLQDIIKKAARLKAERMDATDAAASAPPTARRSAAKTAGSSSKKAAVSSGRKRAR